MGIRVPINIHLAIATVVVASSMALVSPCIFTPALAQQSPTSTPVWQFQLEDSFNAGMQAFKHQDYTSAMQLFHQGADHSYAPAQYMIGWIYMRGSGVQKDDSQALQWFRKAADQGYPAAEDMIGWLYAHGAGVQTDYSQALQWFRKAADRGDPTGEDDIGRLYARGWGMQKDYSQALQWFRKAADQGLPMAEIDVGRLYQDGLGVQRNEAEAAEWYREAAASGDPAAQKLLQAMTTESAAAAGRTPVTASAATETMTMHQCIIGVVEFGADRVPMKLFVYMSVPDWRSLSSSGYVTQVLEIASIQGLEACRREQHPNPIKSVNVWVHAENRTAGGNLIIATRQGTNGPWSIDSRGLNALRAEMRRVEQQQLCQAVHDIRQKYAGIMASLKKETNPLKRQEIAQSLGPVLAEAQRELSFGEFNDFKGRVLKFDALGNAFRLSILVDCGQGPPAAAMYAVFEPKGAPIGFGQKQTLSDTDTNLNTFRPLLREINKGDEVSFSGTNVELQTDSLDGIRCGDTHPPNTIQFRPVGQWRDQCDQPVEYFARITKLSKGALTIGRNVP
ncbi:MAG: sel1 repeat family protein [Alphaproteobacteria bacterium]|nr:sel1 repeat family protein [Alphaproteobacteria bacterium]